jgi:hypothetical protein
MKTYFSERSRTRLQFLNQRYIKEKSMIATMGQWGADGQEEGGSGDSRRGWPSEASGSLLEPTGKESF